MHCLVEVPLGLPGAYCECRAANRYPTVTPVVKPPSSRAIVTLRSVRVYYVSPLEHAFRCVKISACAGISMRRNYRRNLHAAEIALQLNCVAPPSQFVCVSLPRSSSCPSRAPPSRSRRSAPRCVAPSCVIACLRGHCCPPAAGQTRTSRVIVEAHGIKPILRDPG